VRLDLWTTRLIVGAVVIGWLASLGASMVSDFEPPATLNALFLALASAALAINTTNHGNGHGQTPSTPKELSGHKHRHKDDHDD